MQDYLLGTVADNIDWLNGDMDGNQSIDSFDLVIMRKSLIDYINESISCDGGYITQKFTTVETGHITFKIDENIYVRNDLAYHADIIYEAIETVTGLSFTEGTHGRRTVVNVMRPNTSDDGTTLSEREIDFASASDEVYLSPGYLLIKPDCSLIHELVRVLEKSNSDYSSGTLMSGGFSTYVTSLVIEYLANNHPDTYAVSVPVEVNNSNYDLESDEIYSQSMEYWIENGYPHSSNGLYSLGKMFLTYLHDTKGDFTSWIAAREKLGYLPSVETENEDGTTSSKEGFTPQMQIDLIKSIYGEDIFDGCYDWLKEHESEFFYEYNWDDSAVWDLTDISEFNLYPEFNFLENCVDLLIRDIPVKYNNLEINIADMRFYLEKYKGYETSQIILNVSEECQLELYDANGELIRSCTGGQGISLENVYSIKLVGEGVCSEFYITNYTKIEKHGYITTEFTTVETENITIKIDENIYVRNDLALHADRIYEAIEAVTGMSYMDGPYGKRLVINVRRPDTDTESEMGGAYAGDEAYISSGDLLINNVYAFIHESIHVLVKSYNQYYPGKTLSEGFTTYTNSLVLEYLRTNYPDTYAIGWSTIEHDYNHDILEDIYTQPLEYWIENGYPSAKNGLYGVGRMILAYLHDTQGDYTSWIEARNKLGYIEGTYTENEDGTTSWTDGFTPQMQIDMIESVYGEGILDGCYDWLKENEESFIFPSDWIISEERDFTEITHIDLYPFFYFSGNEVDIFSNLNIPVKHNKLEIDLAPTRFYLEEYKGYDTSELKLLTDSDSYIFMYNESGNIVNSCYASEEMSLDGIYKVTLLNPGTVTKFEITGYKKPEFHDYDAGFITSEYTEIETENIIFKIDKNIYVRSDLELHADRIYEAIEAVTGMSYTDAPYGDGEKVVINVHRPVNTECELGSAYGGDEVTISSGDLLLNDTITIIHEMVHNLEYRHDRYFSGTTLTEGFSTHTTSLALKYLEANYPDTYAIGEMPEENNDNYGFWSDEIYTQTIEYWMENGYPDGNGLYCVGRLILAYLHDTKGDFTSWIEARNKIGYIEGKYTENEDGTTSWTDGFTPQMQIEMIESVYGEGILDGCYDWLKENEEDFIFRSSLRYYLTRDFTQISHIDLYPCFYNSGNEVNLLSMNIPIIYNNLEVDIETTRFYLEKYKGYDTTGMVLNINEECQLAFYDSNGALIGEYSGGEDISLENVYTIKLTGEGTCSEFKITGYSKAA